jgi:hypothetical protein
MTADRDSSKEDTDVAMLTKHVNDLSEFFDSVHIFCSRHESNDTGTINANRGAGNWFARYGQIKEWILKQEEASRVNARNSMADE